jgi:Uma2 family endonuclease
MSTEQPKRTGPDTGLIEQAVPPKPEPTERLTFEEYLVKYADVHAEWFPDGHVEVITGNNAIHTRLLGFLFTLLTHILEARNWGEVFMSGLPMRLDSNLPVRIPDLVVLRNEHLDRVQMNFIDGPADIVVEIISPESDVRDRGAKLAEFEAGGVPEYWLIDPLRQYATFYGRGADGRYRPLPLDNKGRLTSQVLPGFALPAAALWQSPLPRGGQVLAYIDAMQAD